MLGLLPLKMALSLRIEADSDAVARCRAETRLVDSLIGIPHWSRGAIQRGLLRANTVLVGAFVATDHRACPLASAVWELTDQEPASQFQVELSLAELGLTPEQAREFASAFDEWARVSGFVRIDDDRARVLTHVGRSQLLMLFENLAA